LVFGGTPHPHRGTSHIVGYNYKAEERWVAGNSKMQVILSGFSVDNRM